jgi:hypothetical protein
MKRRDRVVSGRIFRRRGLPGVVVFRERVRVEGVEVEVTRSAAEGKRGESLD